MNQVTIGKAVGASPDGWHRIAAYLRCPHEYLQSEVRKIKVPFDTVSDPLAQGLLFHAMRARWFACGFKTDEETWLSIKRAAEEAIQEMPAPCARSSEDAAMALFQSYIQHWANVSPKPKPVACEYLLEYNFEADLKFTARIDDVSWYEEAGGLAIGEAKTTSDFGNSMKEYFLHGQPYLQAALWGLAPQGAAIHGPIKGFVLDLARKPQGTPGKKGFKKAAFQRVFQPIKPETLAWFIEEMKEAKRAAKLLQWDSKARRNVTACTRMIGRARVECPYLQLCAHGKTAAGGYELEGGQGLMDWAPTPGKTTPPW